MPWPRTGGCARRCARRAGRGDTAIRAKAASPVLAPTNAEQSANHNGNPRGGKNGGDGGSYHPKSAAPAPAPVAPALSGPHQLANAALAVAIARHAAQALGRPLGDGDVLRGLAEVRWPGRLERIAADVLLDCAHNVEGAKALAVALPPAPRRVLVTSIVRDKDAAGMLSVLAPEFDCIVITRSQSERASDPQQLAGLISRTRGSDWAVECVEDPVAAFALARTLAHQVPGGLVVVAGSIFLVGALRAHVLGHGDGVAEASDPLP